MNQDIVGEMVQQMGLTPQMADQLQNQQGGAAGYPGQGGHGGYPGAGAGAGPGLPGTPEEQMRLMDAAQRGMQPQGPPPQQGPVPDYETESTESTVSTESDINLDKVGLGLGGQKSMMDSIMEYLRDPLIIIVLFVIISLSQVTDLLKKALPAVINSNTYYLLGVRALLMGGAYLTSKLVIA